MIIFHKVDVNIELTLIHNNINKWTQTFLKLV